MDLPGLINDAMQPLFGALPLNKAMPHLLPKRPADQVVLKFAYSIVANPAISAHPELIAGIWLYADDLESSHKISQSITNQSGSFWHAIMHRREGDFDNALYWYRQAGQHPVMARIPDFEPNKFVEMCRAGDEKAVEIQRQEWAKLFEWCALQL